LLGWGGIFCTKATEPGQLMTRLAVEPPTILLCCIWCFLFGEFDFAAVAVGFDLYCIEGIWESGLRPFQKNFLCFGGGDFQFHVDSPLVNEP
jgi:hypothetical protein